jgi:DNA repair protein RadC
MKNEGTPMGAMTLKGMDPSQRPQERLEAHGPEALSDSELLAMLLRSGSQKMDVLSLAASLITKAKTLGGLLNWDLSDFTKQHGIGKVKALQLITVFEVARRILRSESPPAPRFDAAGEFYDYMRPLAMGLNVEKFWVVSLNAKNRLLRLEEVSTGIAGGTVVHPREAYKQAITSGASAIIAAHNHPSGDPTPSRQDMEVTRKLRDAGNVLGIKCTDHIILGIPDRDPRGLGYFSFLEANMLPQ